MQEAVLSLGARVEITAPRASSSGRMRGQRNSPSRAFGNIPVSETRLVAFANGPTERDPGGFPNLVHQQGFGRAQPLFAERLGQGPASSEPVAEAQSPAAQPQSHTPHVHTWRSAVAAQLPILALQQQQSQHMHETHWPMWRRFRWMIGILLSILVPRLLFRIGLFLIEAVLRVSVTASFRAASAANVEIEQTGNRFIDFLEDTLDMCLTDGPREPPTTPANAFASAAAATAAQAAATAMVRTGGTNFSAAQMAAIVEQSVQAAAQAVAPTVAAPESPSWRLPGWVLVMAGMWMPGVMAHLRPAP